MSQTARQHDADLTSTREDVPALVPLPKDQQRDQARRADVIGIFANDADDVRLIGALILEQNDEWAYRACCMTLETLSAVDHNPTVSLPVMAASPKPDPAWTDGFYTIQWDTTGWPIALAVLTKVGLPFALLGAGGIWWRYRRPRLARRLP